MPGLDVTELANAFQSSFVTAGTDFIYAELLLIPGMQWLSLPIISPLVQAAIHFCLNLLVGWAVMEAFFLETALKKANQAETYLNAVGAKNALPPTASDAEYEKAEQSEMAAFRSLVLVSD